MWPSAGQTPAQQRARWWTSQKVGRRQVAYVLVVVSNQRRGSLEQWRHTLAAYWRIPLSIR
jgi:hypothetical protein